MSHFPCARGNGGEGFKHPIWKWSQLQKRQKQAAQRNGQGKQSRSQEYGPQADRSGHGHLKPRNSDYMRSAERQGSKRGSQAKERRRDPARSGISPPGSSGQTEHVHPRPARVASTISSKVCVSEISGRQPG